MSSCKNILVTGANQGIGFELCKKLVTAHQPCRVFLCSRDVARGKAAVESLQNIAKEAGVPAPVQVELIQLDVGDDASVKSAADSVRAILSRTNEQLFALVNNAGVINPQDIKMMVNVNTYGVKRVSEAFRSMLQPTGARIVNVGSGAGPSYVARACQPEGSPAFLLLTTQKPNWSDLHAYTETAIAEIEKKMATGEANGFAGYGLSKAVMHKYTELLAAECPNATVSAVSPGYIETNMTQSMSGNKLPVEQGTIPLLHCMFSDEIKAGEGFYYGSDCQRSPLHFMRDPGTPAFKGY